MTLYLINLTIDIDRKGMDMKKYFDDKAIENEVAWLSSISDTQGDQGVTRLLYSQPWIDAQKAMVDKFDSLNIESYHDEIGNLFGRVVGSESPDTVIASGSHIDTVVNGGRLDGQLGIIAAYMAVDYLQKTYGQPKKTLEVFAMAEEEGSRFPYAFWGSKSIFGLSKQSEVAGTKDASGVVFDDAMRKAGFDFKKEDASRREDIEAFIEVHIEQGITLENQKKEIGIVNNIVGQKRFTVVLTGEANHAGTTKMSYRKDTVHCFSAFAVKAFDAAGQMGDPLVLTFGHVTPQPNTVNVVPGKLTFMIDTRHTDQEALNSFEATLRSILDETCKEFGIEADVDLWMDAAPVAMDQSVVDSLVKSSEDLGLDTIVMHSGAGHDSQIIAPFVPTAMIFTPSIKGISHNPKEATDVEYLNYAITLLAKTLHDLAY